MTVNKCKERKKERKKEKRGVGGREVNKFSRENYNDGFTTKNERDFTIYTEKMLYLQKLIFNIRVRRAVRMPPRQKIR